MAVRPPGRATVSPFVGITYANVRFAPLAPLRDISRIRTVFAPRSFVYSVRIVVFSFLSGSIRDQCTGGHSKVFFRNLRFEGSKRVGTQERTFVTSAFSWRGDCNFRWFRVGLVIRKESITYTKRSLRRDTQYSSRFDLHSVIASVPKNEG